MTSWGMRVKSNIFTLHYQDLQAMALVQPLKQLQQERYMLCPPHPAPVSVESCGQDSCGEQKNSWKSKHLLNMRFWCSTDQNTDESRIKEFRVRMKVHHAVCRVITLSVRLGGHYISSLLALPMCSKKVMGQFSVLTARRAECLSACLVSQLTSQAPPPPTSCLARLLKVQINPLKPVLQLQIFTMCHFLLAIWKAGWINQ